jgi:hypothetical protein
MKVSLVLGALLLCMSCANRRPLSSSSISRAHTPQGSWVDLLPQMELKIENAYFDPAMPRQGLSGYLGMEIARYQVGSGRGLSPLGIRMSLISYSSIPLRESGRSPSGPHWAQGGAASFGRVPIVWTVRTCVEPYSVRSIIENELRQASGGMPVGVSVRCTKS